MGMLWVFDTVPTSVISKYHRNVGKNVLVFVCSSVQVLIS